MAAIGSLHQYLANLERRGASPELISLVGKIHRESNAREVLPIYTLGHLAFLAKLSYETVDKLVCGSTMTNYKKFFINKNSGGKRKILAPTDDLLLLQQVVLETAIPKSLISSSAHGYVRGKDTLTAVSQHVGAKSLITLDIKNFFNSIDSRKIYPVFLANGYSKLLSLQLTLLTTTGTRVGKDFVKDESGSNAFRYAVAGVGYLPQGAPTSGALSNVIMSDLDSIFESLALELGATYTRYADDLQFSFRILVSGETVNRLISSVRQYLEIKSLVLNSEKIRVQRNENHMRMLGLCISSDGVRVDARYRKRLLHFIYSIGKYGADSVAIRNGKSSGLEVLASLEGHINYVRHVDPNFAMKVQPLVNPLLLNMRIRCSSQG